jgi:hypothetical protein
MLISDLEISTMVIPMYQNFISFIFYTAAKVSRTTNDTHMVVVVVLVVFTPNHATKPH